MNLLSVKRDVDGSLDSMFCGRVAIGDASLSEDYTICVEYNRRVRVD
jgi:hypothetical protein